MEPDPAQVRHPRFIDTIELAIGALDDLVALGEEIDDEWQYVQDLSAAWRDRLEAAAAGRADEVVPQTRARAVDRLAEEARLVADPHRAIDWLSTFPQAVLVALGERP